MKVLHISTQDKHGGAAIAAYRQHAGLGNTGVDSRMLVRHRFTDDDNVVAIQPRRAFRERWHRYFSRYVGRRQHEKLYNARVNNFIEYSLSGGEIDGSTLKNYFDGIDVVNIHAIGRTIDLESLLSSIPSRVPIVITMHDLNPLTGGCHYSGECTGFTQTCSDCPLFSAGKARVKKEYLKKQVAYSRVGKSRISFVAISQWHYETACRSSLSNHGSVKMIHHGVDPDIFHPRGRASAKRMLGLDKQKIVMFGAAQLASPRKGSRVLADALDLLNPANLKLVTFGDKKPQLPGQFQHEHFTNIVNEKLLSVLLRTSDIFVAPSIEEAFGLSALEAAACGSLVIGSAGTGLEDIAVPGRNGKTVPAGNSRALAAAIEEHMDSEIMASWGHESEQWIAKHYSLDVNAAAYSKLYQQAISKVLASGRN